MEQKSTQNVNPNSNELQIVRFCPFTITKWNDEEGITLTNISNLHFQCAKESREDVCLIQGVGVNNSNISSDRLYDVLRFQNASNVRIQGFTFTGLSNGAVMLDGENMSVLDAAFVSCQAPPTMNGAVLEVTEGSSATVVDTTFQYNSGGAIENHGYLTVTHSFFQGNIAFPIRPSNDVVDTRGAGVGGAIMNAEGARLLVYGSSFDQNQADKAGPAIWSYQAAAAIDLGSNCGSSNYVVDYIDTSINVSRCDGILHRFTEDGQENVCATFGTACS